MSTSFNTDQNAISDEHAEEICDLKERIITLGAEKAELVQRLTERTAAYEFKDVLQVKRIAAMW